MWAGTGKGQRRRMRRTPAPGHRRRWNACRHFAGNSRRDRRQRVWNNRAYWIQLWWTNSTCRCWVRSCCMTLWRAFIIRRTNRSVAPRHLPRRCRRHRRRCRCCHRRRYPHNNVGRPLRPPGHPTAKPQCAVSVEASSRSASSKSRWKELTDCDRRSLTIASRRRHPWCTRMQLLPNGAPTLGNSTLIITGRCCRWQFAIADY